MNAKPGRLLYWLFVLSAGMLFIFKDLFREGQFMDGCIYVCVGRNLAEGNGSFWQPQFSPVFLNPYMEQPPLLFGLESIFFRVLGDTIYTERIYSSVIFLLNALLMVGIYRFCTRNHTLHKELSWLPLLYWIIIPVTGWSFVHIVSEITMSVFCLLAAWCFFRASDNTKLTYGFYTLAAFALVCSALTKGLQGLFPLVIPFLQYLAANKEKSRKLLWGGSFVITILVLFLLLLYLIPESRKNISGYFSNRLLRTFAIKEAETTSNRIYILWRSFTECLPVLGIVAIGFWLGLKRKVTAELYRNEKIVLLLTGLCGIVPLMITKEQRGFYITTALPFIALWAALQTAPVWGFYLKIYHDKIYRLVRWPVMLLFISILIWSMSSWSAEPKRDAGLIADVKEICNCLPTGTIVGIPHEMRSEWALRAYLMRYGKISLDDEQSRSYYLLPAGHDPGAIPPQFQNHICGIKAFRLYHKKN